MKTTTAHRAGRPRDPAIDDAIVTATVRLLGEHGYAGVSMESIAAEAGVTKPTIYRRWPTKAMLVAEALERRRSAMTTTRDHGTLRDDLLAMVAGDLQAVQSASGVILGVAFAARGDSDLDEAIRRWVDADTQARLDAVLERAAARGEIDRAAVDSRFVLRTITAILLGGLFRVRPDEQEFLTRVVDDLLLPSLVRGHCPIPTTDQP